jgi:stage II sporulation protein D
MIRLKGRGYGHGVGLCQDGAMQMARKGKTYQEIIQHYFVGVSIINYSDAIGFCDDSMMIDIKEEVEK